MAPRRGEVTSSCRVTEAEQFVALGAAPPGGDDAAAPSGGWNSLGANRLDNGSSCTRTDLVATTGLSLPHCPQNRGRMYPPVRAPIDILLVEDDPADTLLMQEALATPASHHRLHVVRDGVEAMDFLLRGGSHSSAPRPMLILLDLNLPRMNGLAVLAELKADEHLRSIPVIVLTSSEAETDVARSYASHASAYITKPIELERFTEIMRKIETFYLSVVKLPHSG